MVGQGALRECLLDPGVEGAERLGRAMIAVVRHGAPKRVLENADINEVEEKARAAPAR